MSLWIALHLPLLPLEVFRPRWSSEAAAIVFEHDRVLALSAPAAALGIRRDMRRAGVLLLAGEVLSHERDARREAQTLQEAALALLQYSPMLAEAEEATLLIDITASLRLFGGIRRLCRRIRQTVGQLGLSVHLSCAPTAQGAWLLAQSGGAGNSGKALRALSPATLQRRLDRLPLHLLPAARLHEDWLHGVGCRSLGELRRLPRAPLQRRCGRPLLQALDRAHGDAPELFDWIVAPPAFHARIELPDRVEHAEALLFAARHLLTQMAGWLNARQLAVRRIAFQMEHERGRQAIAPTPLEILLAEASWREEHLLRLLKERLAQLTLAGPVIAVSLAALQVEAMDAPSQALFPEPGGSPEEHARLIELLTARLGPDAVLQAAPQADHRPEIANAWTPVLQQARTGPAVSLPDYLPRPIWLLQSALPLSVRDHRPFYRSALKVISPPERIEAGWWNEQTVTRDYFVAEDREHVRYWIYRERIGDQSGARAPWFLHGLFG
ncbi:MAG TPA: DNA polymerase Y family protein [Herbaspirillum sp.]|jgi:protein ImuB